MEWVESDSDVEFGLGGFFGSGGCSVGILFCLGKVLFCCCTVCFLGLEVDRVWGAGIPSSPSKARYSGLKGLSGDWMIWPGSGRGFSTMFFQGAWVIATESWDGILKPYWFHF